MGGMQLPAQPGTASEADLVRSPSIPTAQGLSGLSKPPTARTENDRSTVPGEARPAGVDLFAVSEPGEHLAADIRPERVRPPSMLPQSAAAKSVHEVTSTTTENEGGLLPERLFTAAASKFQDWAADLSTLQCEFRAFLNHVADVNPGDGDLTDWYGSLWLAAGVLAAGGGGDALLAARRQRTTTVLLDCEEEDANDPVSG